MSSHCRVLDVALVAGLAMAVAAPGFGQGVGLSAPGQPYVDCTDAVARHQKLGSGLDVQRRAIEREKALYDALREERQAGTAEARDRLKGRANDEIESQAEEMLENLLEARAALDKDPGRALAADLLKWKGSVDLIQKRVEQLVALRKSFAAGYEYATELRRQSHDLLGHVKAANKLFVDSGLAEAVGGKLAAACGPLGIAAFEGSLFLVDQLALDMGNWDRLLEEQRAADNLNRMKWGLSEVADKMQFLVDSCPAEFGKPTAPSEAASTSLTPPPPDPPSPPPAPPQVSAQKKKGGMSGGQVAVVVLGAGAVAGLAVYAGSLMSQLATTGGAAGECYSSRNCIVSVMSSGCSCGGSLNAGCDWTGGVGGTNDPCGGGQPCRAGLSCNNGRCEGSGGRCPF